MPKRFDSTGSRPRYFRLEIDSLEAFAIFVALIRGETYDEDKVRQLTVLLNESTKPLADAVRAETKPPK